MAERLVTLTAGTVAPSFTLPVLGGGEFSLVEALTAGPVVLIFFKNSCPTCQMAFPYYERLHQAYPSLRVVGISQNNAGDTNEFVQQFGITFPILLDDTASYPVSNAYGLTNVPTLFWIAPSGEIEVSSVAWARVDFDEILWRAAEASASPALTTSAPSNSVPPAAFFRPAEAVPEFRAG